MSFEKAHGHNRACIKDDKEDSFGVNMLKMCRQMGRKMNREREREKNAWTDSENEEVDRLEPSM